MLSGLGSLVGFASLSRPLPTLCPRHAHAKRRSYRNQPFPAAQPRPTPGSWTIAQMTLDDRSVEDRTGQVPRPRATEGEVSNGILVQALGYQSWYEYNLEDGPS
ncbi:hypothetical protein CHU98_g3413 [Xylaria longipes]|nr:hypothetical protein CHU98_g3413 [Xylaria longipes]